MPTELEEGVNGRRGCTSVGERESVESVDRHARGISTWHGWTNFCCVQQPRDEPWYCRHGGARGCGLELDRPWQLEAA
jgi:hypothetical protein